MTPALLSPALRLLGWVAFFATSIYGHVGLKLAVMAHPGQPLAATLSAWGLSAYLSWFVSAGLWMMVLEQHSLLAANNLAALRYVLVSVVSALLWQTPLGPRQLAGIALITAGVALVA